MISAGVDAAAHASVRLMFMPDSIHSVAASWPLRDSVAPESVAGEKDACGVGFLAQLSGEAQCRPRALISAASTRARLWLVVVLLCLPWAPLPME